MQRTTAIVTPEKNFALVFIWQFTFIGLFTRLLRYTIPIFEQTIALPLSSTLVDHKRGHPLKKCSQRPALRAESGGKVVRWWRSYRVPRRQLPRGE